jgi:RNA polymerase sigma-70 factor (ECF subfamily)
MNQYSVELELIAAVKRGDPHAFDLLVIRYQSRILKIVARFIKDPSEMLDVCQEILFKVYRALPSFRGDSAFYTWLYRIAVNTSKNYVLSQGRRLPDLTLEVFDKEGFLIRNTPKESSTPEGLMLSNEIEDVVFDTIEHLPQDLKTAIMLREMDGMSYEEIATIMDCPVGTVRSRIFRARAAIDRNVQPLLQQ